LTYPERLSTERMSWRAGKKRTYTTEELVRRQNARLSRMEAEGNLTGWAKSHQRRMLADCPPRGDGRGTRLGDSDDEPPAAGQSIPPTAAQLKQPQRARSRAPRRSSPRR